MIVVEIHGSFLMIPENTDIPYFESVKTKFYLIKKRSLNI